MPKKFVFETAMERLEAIVTALGHPAAVRGEVLSAEELADLAGALEKALA